MKTNSERRNFFKKVGMGTLSAGLLSALPLSLFSRASSEANNPAQKPSISITINPMAVQRENKK